MARRAILKIGGDASGAKSAIRDVKDGMSDLDRQKAEARVTIATEAADARLKVLNDRLERLSKQEATPRVKMAMGTTLAQIERIEAKLEKLRHEDVNIDVDIKRGALERVNSGLGGIGQKVSGVLGAIGSSGANPLRAFSNVMALLPPQILAVVAALGGLLIPLLIPLAASFAAAAAGAVLLAGTLGLALIGPFGLVAVAVARVVKVLQALKQEQNQRRTVAAQQQAAAQQEAAAQQQVADAYKNVQEQAQAARRAQEDAARAVPRDRLGVDQAKLNQSQARLDRQKAERELRQGLSGTGSNSSDLFRKLTDVDVQTDPAALSKLAGAAGGSSANAAKLQDLVLNVRQAKLRERGATLDLSDAVHKLNEDRRTEADFAKRGLAAYKPYTDALEQVRRAQTNLRTASHRASVELASQGTAMDNLSPADRRLAGRLKTIGDRVKDAFGPAIGRVTSGIVDAVDRISKALNDRRVRAGLRNLGSAIGSSFRALGRELSDPKFRRFFTTLLSDSAKIIPDLTSFARVLLRTFRDLATATLPKVVGGIRGIRKALSGFDRNTSQRNTSAVGPQGLPIANTDPGARSVRRFKGFVDGLLGSFREWVKLIKGVGLILGAFFRAGKGQGDKLAGSIGDAAIALGKKLNDPKHQKQILSFFRQVRSLAADIAFIIGKIADLLRGGPKVGGIGLGDILSAATGPVKAPIDAIRGHPGQAIEDMSPLAKLIKKAVTGKAMGGLLPGPGGFGDNRLGWFEGGEFTIRRAIVQSIGVPALATLNATGRMPASVGGGGGLHIENLNVLTPGGGPPDPRSLLPSIDRELRARGWG